MSVFDDQKSVIACQWCGKRLGAEFYYKCPKCDEIYCFVHMDRHIGGSCKHVRY